MVICRTTDEARAWRRARKRAGRSIGFVPTMGYLHEGHLSLVDLAKKYSDAVVVSIFVNPTQFGEGEDLAKYPRDEERDLALCENRDTAMVFCPESPSLLYASDASTIVEETCLSTCLCGAQRPGHFRGVATIVAKLFNIIEPDIAVFGQKDAQQIAVIRRMARDLFFPVSIITGPIIRDSDGLALSSRNTYLSASERKRATALSRALCSVVQSVVAGERASVNLYNEARSIIEESAPDAIDYIEIRDLVTLQRVEIINRSSMLAVAVRYGATRLIDNVMLDPEQIDETNPLRATAYQPLPLD